MTLIWLTHRYSIISSSATIAQFRVLRMSRDLLSYLSGVITEVSFQNEPLCVAVILKHSAPALIFWKEMIYYILCASSVNIIFCILQTTNELRGTSFSSFTLSNWEFSLHRQEYNYWGRLFQWSACSPRAQKRPFLRQWRAGRRFSWKSWSCLKRFRGNMLNVSIFPIGVSFSAAGLHSLPQFASLVVSAVFAPLDWAWSPTARVGLRVPRDSTELTDKPSWADKFRWSPSKVCTKRISLFPWYAQSQTEDCSNLVSY